MSEIPLPYLLAGAEINTRPLRSYRQFLFGRLSDYDNTIAWYVYWLCMYIDYNGQYTGLSYEYNMLRLHV